MPKVVLVTGGTRGIGAAIARMFLLKGYQVVVTYATNAKTAEEFTRITGVQAFKMDVRHFESYAHALQNLIETLGGVSILVNNAGVVCDGILSKMTPDMWHAVIDTNLSSLFYTCRAVLPFMVRQSWGRIINISSINALKGQKGQTNYAAAKAGILGFTKSLAQEVAKFNVTVNAVAPGYTKTDMIKGVPDAILEDLKKNIPLRRFASPEDIAKAVVFLASYDAAYMTGQTLHVNGGHLMP